MMPPKFRIANPSARQGARGVGRGECVCPLPGTEPTLPSLKNSHPNFSKSRKNFLYFGHKYVVGHVVDLARRDQTRCATAMILIMVIRGG